MLDLNSRSAPTSLTMASKEQQLNLNSNHNRSSLKSSLGELSSTSTLNGKIRNVSRSDSYEWQLIDSKFNELAKKILEELKHSQYSKDFFQAIDSILKEPLTKTIKRNTHKHLVFYNRYQNANTSDRRSSEQQSNYSFGKNSQSNLLKQQQQRNLPSAKQQQLALQKQKSAIPISAHNGYSSSPRKSPLSTNEIKNEITKSATTGDVTLRRRLKPLKPGQIPLGQYNTVNSVVQKNETFNNNARQRNYSTKLSKLDDDEDDEGEEEEEDDDDDVEEDLDEDYDDDFDIDVVGDMENDENDNIRKTIPSLKGTTKHSYVATTNTRKQMNPLTKSKTLSDTSEIISETTKLDYREQVPSLTKHQPTAINQGQKTLRLNPIVRSNTITNTDSYKPAPQEQEIYRTSSNEPKSMVLNSRDIGSLYKPHMNYSTSVLGNHRLSDDDEIIIIPTQSPSLVSPSPDGDANLDELNERFSISRTKSFWEKLSKGNHNKRATKETSAETTTNNSNKISSNNYANKNTGSKMNEQVFERMDSTGGSNSNYNGSSSGDENGGCYSQQHPTIRELQEMSRQNRLRQTR